MPRVPVRTADLGRITAISDVRLNADGSLVAAVARTSDLTDNHRDAAVVVAAADGQSPARVLAGSGRVELLPRWSPDGLVLATAAEDDGGWQLRLHDLAAGSHHVLVCSWPDAVEELSWSPDAGRLLFVCREPVDRATQELPDSLRPPLRLTRLRYYEDGIGWTVNRPRQAYLADPVSGAVTRLSSGGHDDAEFGWHPDGRSVVFVSQRQAGAELTLMNDIYRLDLADPGGTDAAVRLTSTRHLYGQPRFSPDGTRIAVTATDFPSFPSTCGLAVLPADGGAVTVLSEQLDCDCTCAPPVTDGPLWTDDHTLVTLVETAGAVHGYEFGADDPGQFLRILGGDRQVTALDARAGTLAFASSSPGAPPALLSQRGPAAERTLYAPNAGLQGDRDVRPALRGRAAAADGTQIDYWLTLPDAGRWQSPYPLLVCMQGGLTQYGYQWSHEFQSLSAAGFAVLYLNPRGSAGYGTAWMKAVVGAKAAIPGTGWGTDDTGDVVAVLDTALREHAELDPARLGVLGGSYGALVVTWLLATTDKFRAGWAERGPYNLYTLAGTNDESPWSFTLFLGRTQVEDPAAYWTSSPLRVAAGITDPLMIVHSEEDRRCPIQQAEELFMALKLLGRPVEFLRFPGESHGLSGTGSPVHQLQRLDLMIEWFERWLAPAATVPDGADSN
jgi:dipeptidyl aminopeptidase/acylaminoacyl peptidase